MTKDFLLLLLVTACQNLFAQQPAIELSEIIISDLQLREFSETHKVTRLNDSVIFKSTPTLRSLLNNSTLIYFKENGPGSVASPSFRGTTAQQTAVIWNGINVNSQFNGQTDFNTVSSTDFSSVDVRAGGGSVIYGSSAIGGSIHLENELSFGKIFRNQLFSSYGSFNTKQLNYKLSVSDDNLATQFSYSNNSSDNDYEYPNGGKNINGQYHNHSFSAALGIRINQGNLLKIYSNYFNGIRHFSLLSPTDTKTKYHDFNTRNMLVWINKGSGYQSTLRLAHLIEEYKYFENIGNQEYYFGSSANVVMKYDFIWTLQKNITINPIVEYNQVEANGSDISSNSRKVAAAALLMKHQILPKVLYEIGIRKESANDYDSPFLYSGGIRYDVSPAYSIAINASKNFRIPTFNDLYWFDGGNPDLKPETSSQIQISNQINIYKLHLGATAYYNHIKDLIQWLPGTTALWHPENVHQVEAYGFEATAGYNHSMRNHKINVNTSYGYTVSQNIASGKQLIYVPFHKFLANTIYKYKQLSVNYRLVFNGAVFTRTDNNPLYKMDPYAVSDLGISYIIVKKNVHSEVGLRSQNIFDQQYQVTEGRIYPGRNFNIFLNIKL
ncbi:MAG TPA: TonB-dependent receptor [Flavobacterium sp.]|jgi:iron complex outermembrane receptor protein